MTEKLYNDVEDLQVRAITVFAKANDAYAYSDSAKTVKISAADLDNLFQKGLLLINDGGVMCKPVSYSITSAVGTVSYFKSNNTIATLKSKEYTA